MDDQKEKLTAIGIPCAALHANNKNKEKEVFKNVKYENIKQSDKYEKVLVCGGKEV